MNIVTVSFKFKELFKNRILIEILEIHRPGENLKTGLIGGI